MPGLDAAQSFLEDEHGLAVVSTTQSDGRVLSSVVNGGVIDHPVTGTPHVAFVSTGRAARVGHIRRGSQVTVLVRRDWKWVSVTGPADLIGPDDLPEGIDVDGLRLLRRDVFRAAGGTHDDWDEYDRTMTDDGRIVVLVSPDRILGVAS